MSLFALALVTVASASHSVPRDAPTLCAAPYEEVTVDVQFSAYHENAVQIVDSWGRVVASFNNYIGYGAGSEWQHSGGRVTLPLQRDGGCFTVRGLHKDGPPSAWLPWESSTWQQWDDYIAFEDADDYDYTDATVQVLRSRVHVRPHRQVRPGEYRGDYDQGRRANAYPANPWAQRDTSRQRWRTW